MELTPATPIEMIIYYAGLRNEYESAKLSSKQKSSVLALAKKRFEKINPNDLDKSGAFKEESNYDWDEIGLSLSEEIESVINSENQEYLTKSRQEIKEAVSLAKRNRIQE